MFSSFVLLLCTFWGLCARFLIYILLFTDKKKKKRYRLVTCCMKGMFEDSIPTICDDCFDLIFGIELM